MSIYVDSSALLKRYIDETYSADCEEILRSDDRWVTARHTWVEVVRNLGRLLQGREHKRMESVFHDDWLRFDVVEMDARTCEIAAEIAKAHGTRTLDALHLGAAQRAGGSALPFVTYDLRQAQAARALGFAVLGT